MLKKYLASFETEEQYSEFLHSANYVTPNVSIINKTKKIYFNKEELEVGLLVNGELHLEKNVILEAGNTYVLEGVHNGQITIDARTTKPSEWTTIRLNGVTVISDEAYGILYDCPESGNKGYQGLYVTLEKDTHNFIVCNKPTPVEGDETFASIDSWKDLTVQGVGYLAVYNNIGHGLRGETLNIAGPHVYVDVDHDGVHGKNVNVYDGLFYVQNAKDGFGTTDNGVLNIFGGEFEFVGVRQDNFDSKQTGIFAIENLTGTNLIGLEDIYEEGTVTAYPTKEDYEADINGVTINPVITNILSGVYYNADAEGNVVASTAAAGNTVWVNDNPEEIVFSAPLAYIINEGYNVVKVSGKISGPIVRPLDAITITEPKFSKKGKLNGGYDNKLDIYLNGAVIVTEGNAPSIANLPDAGRVKVTTVKNTINAIINKDFEGEGDHDAIKSENNVIIEVKNGSTLYITSNIGDGVDGGEVKFIDSKGAFIVTKCGERGVKGNAVVIGPDAVINSSVIESYITDPNDPEYSTFDGIFVAKGNVVNHEVCHAIVTAEDPKPKLTGFADVYGRNGKCDKGAFGTTDVELKGVAIIGSLDATLKIDMGNAKNLYVNNISNDVQYGITNGVDPVEEQYKAVPYNAEPIAY